MRDPGYTDGDTTVTPEGVTVTETIEPPVEEAPEPEQPERPYHTLLEVWREVLLPARGEMRHQPITPQWATRIVSSYEELTYADVFAVHHRLFDYVEALALLLDEIISSDAECLTRISEEEDRTENSEHYKDVLHSWQLWFLDRELAWDPRDDDAAVTIAAMSEVYKMFFGETGLTAHLESIKFEFTEADQSALAEELQKRKELRLAERKEAQSAG